MKLRYYQLLLSVLYFQTPKSEASAFIINRAGGAQGRIFSGVKTRAGDMSFIGGLAPSGPGVTGFENLTCTAFLIARQWVLTAAHCQYPYLTENGIFLLNTPPERGNTLKVKVEAWIVHNDHILSNYEYADIALLYLNRSIGDIEPVLIANSSTDPIDALKGLDYRGITVSVAGYGFIDDEQWPDTLRKTYMYMESKCPPARRNDETRGFCVRGGPNGESICHGDSGSPAMFETNKNKLAIGIHSAGEYSCVLGLRPWENVGQYVRISWYVDWIKGHMCARDGSKLPGMVYDCP